MTAGSSDVVTTPPPTLLPTHPAPPAPTPAATLSTSGFAACDADRSEYDADRSGKNNVLRDLERSVGGGDEGSSTHSCIGNRVLNGVRSSIDASVPARPRQVMALDVLCDVRRLRGSGTSGGGVGGMVYQHAVGVTHSEATIVLMKLPSVSPGSLIYVYIFDM